jgi:hypothetical protein
MDFTEKFGRLAAFMALNFCLSVLIGTSYIFFAAHSPFELVFIVTALISNSVMIYAALFVPAFLLFLLPGGRWPAGALMGFFQLALITDAGVYKIWHFHLNSMVFNLLTTSGGIDSLEQGWGMKSFYLLLAAALLAAQWLFWRLAATLTVKAKGRGRLVKTVVAVLLLFVVADKGMLAWGMLYDSVPIMRNDKLFPLYQPLKLRSFANKYFGFKLDKPVNVKLDSRYTGLDYPKAPLVIDPPKKPLNIVIIVTDSMRYDMFSKDIIPNTWELGQKATVFSNHYSGGNCTRFGIFSIIYGIYGKYWFPMVGERRGPVLIDVLKKEGYDLRLFAGTTLSFPEFNKTCFVDVPRAGIYDEPHPGDGSVRDSDITDKAVQYIKNRPAGKPYFAFVFYDASHGSYDYTPEFEKFKPSHAMNPLLVNKDNILPLFNKYKNSLGFDDHEAGRILDAIRATGGMKDTVIVITGDHGEPFFEKGYYGHNHSYSAEEVKVPFVYYQPGLKHSVVTTRTSHFDLAPALLPLLGVKNPPSDYSSARGLFAKNEWNYIPVFSWDTAAIVRDTETMVIPMEAYKGGVKVYNNADWQEEGKSADASFIPLLPGFQKEVARFLKTL